MCERTNALPSFKEASSPYHGPSLFCRFPLAVWDLCRAVILPGPVPGEAHLLPQVPGRGSLGPALQLTFPLVLDLGLLILFLPPCPVSLPKPPGPFFCLTAQI